MCAGEWSTTHGGECVPVVCRSLLVRVVTSPVHLFIHSNARCQVIIDMSNPLAPARRQISADSALMCLDKKVIALKATVAGTSGDSLQVFNLDTKTKLKAFQMPENVEYWKWITPSALGLVTAASVFHWDVEVGHWQGTGRSMQQRGRSPGRVLCFRTLHRFPDFHLLPCLAHFTAQHPKHGCHAAVARFSSILHAFMRPAWAQQSLFVVSRC